jgi:hypothetical protein
MTEKKALGAQERPWMRVAAAEIEVGKDRCPICAWPLAATMEQGCVIGNCSYRPGDHREDELRNLKKRREHWEATTRIIAEAYAASLADFTMPLLKRIYDHLTGPPKESDFTLARELRDFLADSPSPTRIHDLREGLSWALDLLDMYDEKLIALGEPRELVYDALHLLAKAKARKALAGADSPSGTAAPPKTEASK